MARRSNLDKMHLEIYRAGEFLGWLQSISYSKRTFKTTQNKAEAKGYVSFETAKKDMNHIMTISNGMVSAIVG